jgi:hypothetical protein
MQSIEGGRLDNDDTEINAIRIRPRLTVYPPCHMPSTTTRDPSPPSPPPYKVRTPPMRVSSIWSIWTIDVDVVVAPPLCVDLTFLIPGMGESSSSATVVFEYTLIIHPSSVAHLAAATKTVVCLHRCQPQSLTTFALTP